jgi:hypothetical protein
MGPVTSNEVIVIFLSNCTHHWYNPQLSFMMKPFIAYVICLMEIIKNMVSAALHLTQFPPAKYPVHPSASQLEGVGGWATPGPNTSSPKYNDDIALLI